MKRQWEKILANLIFDNVLISKKYVKYSYNSRAKVNPIKKWADLNKHISQEDIPMANGYMKRCSLLTLEKCKSKAP